MGADGTRIINLFTQDPPASKGQHPGRASLKNLGDCLKALQKVAEKEQLKSLALPRLATGVGGLDWELVEPLLEQHLGGLEKSSDCLLLFPRRQQAKEPL